MFGFAAVTGEDSLKSLEDDLQEISESVRPSIVKITIPSRTFPEHHEEFPPGFRLEIERPRRELPAGFSRPAKKTHLGIILDEEGYILTSEAVEDARRPQVELSDGRVLEADIIGVERNAHIGLLKVDAEDLEPIQIGHSEDLRQGSLVIIFGNPHGFFNSLSLGVVAGERREVRGKSLIQISVLLNPGDEFAFVVDTDGGMVGVVDSVWSRRLQPFGKIRLLLRRPGQEGWRIKQPPTPRRMPRREDVEPERGRRRGDLDEVFDEAAEAVREAGRATQKFVERFGGKTMVEERPLGGGIVAEGIGFVRPIEDILDVVEALKRGERIRKGYLGVIIDQVTEELRAQIPALGDRAGVVITRVMPESPADRAGIRVWDIVVAVDDEPFRNTEHFRRLIQSSRGEITLTIIRRGKEKEIWVELEELE